MNKEDLLKNIAEKSYDVGFGAKKHFATYDIVNKAPGIIGFLSMVFGVFSLIIKTPSSETASAVLIILGIVSLYIGFYNHKKTSYEKVGKHLTQLFNELKTLYFDTKNLDENSDLSNQRRRLDEIENRYQENSVSEQILFSNWYAHYKFFWELQIGWLDEQLHFKFWKDKLPLSLSISMVAATLMILVSLG